MIPIEYITYNNKQYEIPYDLFITVFTNYLNRLFFDRNPLTEQQAIDLKTSDIFYAYMEYYPKEREECLEEILEEIPNVDQYIVGEEE